MSTDTTELDAAPRAIRDAHDRRGTRVYLVTTYGDGTQHHRTGHVGRTTGRRPCYLLVGRVTDHGSSDILTEKTMGKTIVAGIKYPGGSYRTPDGKPVKPGRNRYTEEV